MNLKVVPKQKNVMKYFWVTFRRPISPIVQCAPSTIRVKSPAPINHYKMICQHYFNHCPFLKIFRTTTNMFGCISCKKNFKLLKELLWCKLTKRHIFKLISLSWKTNTLIPINSRSNKHLNIVYKLRNLVFLAVF